MGGRTGYPDFDNSIGFGGPEYFEDIETWIDPLIGETVATVAALPAVGSCWPGRTVFVNADPTLTNIGTYVRNSDNTAWILVAAPTTSVQVTTFGTNWTAGTGSQIPKVQLNGNRVDLTGSVLLGAGPTGGYTNILTVPAAFQPPSTGARFVGNAILSGGGVAVELQLTAGVLNAPSGAYNIGSLPFGNRVPLHCFWYMD